MSEYHEPIFEPERHDENRDVSPEVDLNELQEYLADTVFENEAALVDVLDKYGMSRRESTGEMEVGMTQFLPVITLEKIAEMKKSGEKGMPFSGQNPERIFTTTIRMSNDDMHELGIYEVTGRSNRKYCFTLKKL